jgi:hypothetical protein
VSTRQLVDSPEEQALLEEIIDEVKPPRPEGARFAPLHFLLFTPFRHPPLRWGSRFGSRAQRGIWYGALEVETSLAEKAYYQFLFAAGARTELKNLSTLWSAYQAQIETKRGVDLTAPAFAKFRADISSPVSYEASQKLGSDMRDAGVDGFLFQSARCPNKGTAVGLFEPAFKSPNPKPGPSRTWICTLAGDACEVLHVNASASPVLVFKRSLFEVSGKLPHPST